MISDAEMTRLREQEYNATVVLMRRVHGELAIMRVRPDFAIPPHRAGQYTSIGAGYWEPRVEGCQPEHLKPDQFAKMVKRAYSISCSVLDEDGKLLREVDDDFLEFYIVLVRDADRRPPALTPRLFALNQGNRLFLSEKITGNYTLDRVGPDDTVIFMATGTGEAPHNKMLLELLRGGHRGMIASVVCVRFRSDLAYLETHQKIAGFAPNYRYIALTTREKQDLQNKMYIQDLVRTGQLEERISRPLDPATTHIFLCGNPKMIGVPQKGPEGTLSFPQPPAVIEMLDARGFTIDRPREPGNIHVEEYW